MAPGVPGGTFDRINDSLYPATVSTFRLDRNEVTVARFRPFVTAVVGGYRPASGSGKHAHLNGGQGLADESTGTGYETGWNTAWNTELPDAQATWDSTAQLGCSATYSVWTPSAGANENKPINCVSWFQAYAFCIWDGGFLASEAEWNYAAAGGSQQRVYPWGSTVPASNAALAVYGCYYNGTGSCTGVTNLANVGSVPAGNGQWSHADLAGNVWEWVFDWNAPSLTQPCVDCANTTDATQRVVRGGGFHTTTPSDVRTVVRHANAPTGRFYDVGIRCARIP
jgi:formylglycine-generating enzyme required for sulfatase activity